MDLFTFLDASLSKLRKTGEPSRRNVKHPGFIFLFLRVRHDDRREAVLDIANATVHLYQRGSGVFTKALRQIKYRYPDLHVRIERVTEPRFQVYLEKLGFVPAGVQTYALDKSTDLPPSKP